MVVRRSTDVCILLSVKSKFFISNLRPNKRCNEKSSRIENYHQGHHRISDEGERETQNYMKSLEKTKSCFLCGKKFNEWNPSIYFQSMTTNSFHFWMKMNFLKPHHHLFYQIYILYLSKSISFELVIQWDTQNIDVSANKRDIFWRRKKKTISNNVP